MGSFPILFPISSSPANRDIPNHEAEKSMVALITNPLHCCWHKMMDLPLALTLFSFSRGSGKLSKEKNQETQTQTKSNPVAWMKWKEFIESTEERFLTSLEIYEHG